MFNKSSSFVPAAILLAVSLGGCGKQEKQQVVSLQQAQSALSAKQYQTATIVLKSYLQTKPEDAAARFMLGQSLLATSDPVSAEKQLRKSLELGYQRDKVEPLLARALIDQGDYRRVLQEIDVRRLSEPGEQAQVLTYLGRAYLGIGDIGLAEQQFAAALKLAPSLPSALLGAVRVKVVKGETDNALQAVGELLAKAPDLDEALTIRAALLRQRGQLPQAASDYQKVLALKPEEVNARANLALLLLDQKDIAGAKKQLEELKRRSPQSLAANYLQALLAYREGNYSEASKYAEIALTGDPTHLPVLFLAAAADYQLQDYTRAETRLRQVLDKNPMNFPAQKLLTATYLRLGQPNRAAKILPYLLRPGLEDDANLAALAGEVFLRNRDFQSAELFFTHSAKLDPGSEDKRTALAMARLGEGKADQAVAELKQIAGAGKADAANRLLVQELLRQGRADQALGVVQKMAEKSPDQPISHYMLAAVLYGMGDKAASRAELDRTLKLDPYYFPAAHTLASLDLAANQPKLAIDRYEALLVKRPNDPQVLSALARLQRKQGATPDAVLKLLERALNANPDAIDAYLEMATAQLEFGMPKEAEATLQKGLARKRSHPQLLDRLAVAQYSQGDLERAINTLFALIEADRTNAVGVYARIAELQTSSKKPAMALQTLQKALAIAPQSIPLQIAYARNLVATDRQADALAIARRLQQSGAAGLQGFLLEGDIKAARNDWGGALASYRAARQRGENGEIIVRMHRSLSMLGKQDEAQRLSGEWLNKSPADPAVLRYIGNAAMQRNDYVSASKLYKQALVGNSDNVEALNNLAFALWQQNQHADALAHAEKALALAPADADVLDTLGWMLNESGQRGRSLLLLQRAAALKVSDPQIQFHLARVLLADKQPEAAKSRLEAALRLGDFPEREEATRLLKAL